MLELSTALRMAKKASADHPMFFAFVAKSASEGKLLIDKKKVPAGEITKAKAECGGGKIFRGRCLGENGVLVFEMPKEPPGTLAKQLKAIAKRDAEMTVMVEVRKAGGLEEDEEEQEGEGEEPEAGEAAPSAADGAVRFKEELKAILPDLVKVEAGAYAQSKAVKLVKSEAMALAQQKSYDQAIDMLAKVDQLVKQALAGGNAPAANVLAGGAEAELKKRIEMLLPMHQKAVAIAPAQKEALIRLSTQAVGLLQKHSEGAGAAIEQWEATIKSALRDGVAAAAAAGASSAAEAMPAENPVDATAILRRLTGLLPDFNEILTKKPQGVDVARLQSLMNTAKRLAESRDFEGVDTSIATLEPLIRQAKKAAAAAPAGGGAKPSIVAMAKARLAWGESRKQISSQLSGLEQSIFAACEENNKDPEASFEIDLAALKDNVQKIYDVALDLDKKMKEIDGRMLDKLDEALNAVEPAKRVALQKEAGDILKEFETYAAGNAKVAEVENNGFVPLGIRTAVAQAVAAMSKVL